MIKMEFTNDEIEILKGVLINYDWMVKDRIKKENPPVPIKVKMESELTDIDKILRKLYK